MLGDFDDQVVLFVVDGRVGNGQRRKIVGSLPCSNSTSTTGPKTCVILPMFSPI
jgi:hypothetical protein